MEQGSPPEPRSWATKQALLTRQFTVFGAAGAVVFMSLSGLLVARLAPPRVRAE